MLPGAFGASVLFSQPATYPLTTELFWVAEVELALAKDVEGEIGVDHRAVLRRRGRHRSAPRCGLGKTPPPDWWWRRWSGAVDVVVVIGLNRDAGALEVGQAAGGHGGHESVDDARGIVIGGVGGDAYRLGGRAAGQRNRERVPGIDRVQRRRRWPRRSIRCCRLSCGVVCVGSLDHQSGCWSRSDGTEDKPRLFCWLTWGLGEPPP